MKAKILPSKP